MLAHLFHQLYTKTVLSVSLFIITGTIGLPQSQVTTQNVVTIEFKLGSIYKHTDCAIVQGCVRFVLLVSSFPGKLIISWCGDECDTLVFSLFMFITQLDKPLHVTVYLVE